ncbi:MAG: sn-glycerol-3-phosphate ABC transporter ATP-binding protein UgpC [Dokdonella sp.]
MARVNLQSLRKVYDNAQVAVADATFEVADGEFLVLVGPSGCGKSTLLRMIAGLETITSGTLTIDDRVVNDIAPKERDIAMVFQNYALYPHMSVAANLAFGLKLRGEARDEIERRVSSAAETLGLTALLARKPAQLSGGQRQRVALGRALVRNPKVFLLDEPLSNLDAKLRLSMRVEIARLHRALGATMIYVTHDQIEAMTLGQRIVVLKDGEIQQIDTPMALYERPANLFVAGFLGSPAMNFLRGRLIENDGWRFETEGISIALGNDAILTATFADHADRELILGVRPEDIVPLAAGDTSGSGAFKVHLDLVEPVGNEIFLNLRLGSNELVARVPPQNLPLVGPTIEVALKTNRLHWFDPGTEVRIA